MDWPVQDDQGQRRPNSTSTLTRTGGARRRASRACPAPERVIFVDGGPEDRKAAALADNEVDGEPSLRIDLFPDVQSRNPDVIGWTKDAPNAWIDPCPGELGFNTEVAPWDDPDMRWAISYALPKQQIADAGSGGYGQTFALQLP